MDDIPQKQCSNPDCRQWYPATSEFFNRDKSKRDGFASQCKQCTKRYSRRPAEREKARARRKAYRQTHKEQVLEERRRYYQSHREREIARVSAFYKRPEIRERRREYSKARYQIPEIRERERIRRRGYKRIRRQNTPPRIRIHKSPEERKAARRIYAKAYNKAYRERSGVRERQRAYALAYYNRPETREAQRAYARTYHRTHYHLRSLEWRRRKKAYDLNRRARKQAVPGSHTVQESREQYDRQKGKCYYCSTKIEWGAHHEDHIIPLSREGATNFIHNIAITCPTCNLSKHDRFPHEWPEGGKLL